MGDREQMRADQTALWADIEARRNDQPGWRWTDAQDPVPAWYAAAARRRYCETTSSALLYPERTDADEEDSITHTAWGGTVSCIALAYNDRRGRQYGMQVSWGTRGPDTTPEPALTTHDKTVTGTKRRTKHGGDASNKRRKQRLAERAAVPDKG